MYLEPAAAACGVAHATLYEWLARGRVKSSNSTPGDNGDPKGIEPGTRGLGDSEGLYADFVDAINKAEALLELGLTTDAMAKSKKSKNPLAPIIVLSRRFRDRWSEQIQVASAGREAIASMERIKAAWDTPEVVEGEYKVLEDGAAKLKAVNPEANDSQMRHSPNLSEAKIHQDEQSPPGQIQNYNGSEQGVSGFHLPPADLVPDTEPDTEDADQDEQEPDTNQPPNDIDRPAPDSTAHARQSNNY